MSLRMLFNICRQTWKTVYVPTNITYFRIGYSQATQLHKKPLYKSDKAKKFRFYIIHKYMEYFKTYTNVVQRRFPKAAYIYRLFTEGTRDFFADLRQFITILRALNLNGKSLKDLTRAEIELYEQMPKDMRHVAPVLIFSILPLAYYIVFPLIYLFPRQLLCRHFWNLQQKSEFNVIFLRRRLLHNKPVFRYLQLQLKGLHGNPVHKKWSHVLGQLGSGVHPTAEQIIECKDLFVNGPYHLMYLSRNHVKHLLKMHEVHSGWFRRTRLGDKAIILQAMDRAILREGGIQELHVDALRNACLIRGLNPMNMRNEDMAQWLSQWIMVSDNSDTDSLSLLLHCSVLLGYNQPTNWQLLYPNKAKAL